MMKLWVAGALVLSMLSSNARAETCQDKVPKGGAYVFSHEEPIEGGRRCYVRSKDGKGEPIYQGVAWDDPPKQDDKGNDDKQPPGPGSGSAPPPPGGCEATEARLLEMWQANTAARAASTSSLPPATRTFAVAHVLDEKCELVAQVQGEFHTSGGRHAERQILDQLDGKTALAKKLKKGFTVFWLIDQVPCQKPQPPAPPPGGYCTAGLKSFAKSRKLAQRVFVAVQASKSKPGNATSAKQFAMSGQVPTRDNFFELTEFTVKP